MKDRPEVFLPQVAVLTGFAIASPDLPHDFIGNEARILNLFGEKARKAVELLRQPFEISSDLDPSKYQLDFSLANSRAERWLQRDTT